jgi:DNA repair exonuclease SbcCD ATPase subunit
MTLLISLGPTTTQEQLAEIDWLTTENHRLRAELSRQESQLQQFQAALEEEVAAKRRLEVQLMEAQAMLSQLVNEHKRLTSDLNDLKQAPFKSRRRTSANRPSSSSGRRGRPVGHPGQGRARPERIDQTERVEVGDTCPDCGTPLSGETQVRTRVVEDIEPVRPTVVTCYEIERGWCPHCRTYQENPVTAALPNYRLGLRLMLFVV